ncbi:MAG: hypothetical protein D6813_14900 [Calditrichaeota bacterium]|nr:MAG: hypothetical protein D6813_14900 [Calditrichota bacterium]
MFKFLKYCSILLVIWSCAGTSSGTKNIKSNYTVNVGVATLDDIQKIYTKVFTKYLYQLEREEEFGSRLYVETQWKDRKPFEDEKAAGVVAVRSRIILQTRPRIKSGVSYNLHQVQFIAENLVKYHLDENWHPAPLTKMCRDYFKKIANDFKLDLTSIVREY